jgi:hypothetical protein
MMRKLSKQQIANNIKTRIANDKKKMALIALNGIIWRRLSDSHHKDFLKKESYIKNDPTFLASIAEVRQVLGLTTTPDTSDEDYRTDHWIIEQISHKKVKDLSHEEMVAHYQQFHSHVLSIINKYNLGKAWVNYIEDFIIFDGRPEINFTTFPTPKNIKIEDINEEGEVLLRLKPGLRHEDYERAWDVVSRPLGEGKRVSKPYTNIERSQQMLRDKEAGMKYKEIAKKYYPNQDPEAIIETIRKAIYRERQRQKWDK